MTGKIREPRPRAPSAPQPAATAALSVVFALLAILFAGPVHALGLGQATVRSYLDQPLDVRIDLISRSEAEMATVTAGLASPADFQVMGLSRAAIAAPLEFTIHRGLADPHIQVTSRAPMREPVVQLVVEVVWSSGRMLRQYTLFLDPPTFEAAAPLPATPTPRAAPEPEPEPPVAAEAEAPAAPVADAGPPFDPAPEPAEEDFSEVPGDVAPPSRDLVIDEPVESTAGGTPTESLAERPVSAAGEAVEEDPVAPAASPDEPIPGDESDLAETVAATEPEAAPEPEPEAASEPTPAPFRAVLPEAGQSLPSSLEVRRGDTLWSLSRTYAEDVGASVNQVMLAVQQKNPEAFIEGNINAMMAGQVLRMPDRDEVLRTSARDAMIEVMRQEERYRARQFTATPPDQLPTVDNLAAAPGERTPVLDPDPAEVEPAPGPEPEPQPDPEAEPVTEEALASEEPPAELDAVAEDSRLELVPPAERQEEQPLGQGNSDATAVSSGESVVEELARTQEELANARQENSYLEERIAELEAELARQEADSTAGVEDTNLAEMEDRLRAERQAGEPEPELDLTPAVEPEPWMTRYFWWLIGGAVVIVAAFLLFLRRRRTLEPEAGFTESVDADGDGPLPGADSDAPEAQRREPVIEPATNEDTEPPAVGSTVDEKPAPGPEAVELDVDDPETRLDLARAYLAMGKTDEVRELLEAVIEDGNEGQAREARDMLREL